MWATGLTQLPNAIEKGQCRKAWTNSFLYILYKVSHELRIACVFLRHAMKDLENVENRALSIICPGLAYRKVLELSNISGASRARETRVGGAPYLR